MKVSLNWVKQFTATELSVNDLVAKIGAQLGAVEAVTDLGQRYQDILIAKIITCDDHPSADRLHVVMIDDGGAAQNVTRDGQGYVQVVCGAPNVRAGLLVAWLPPGSTVPASYDKDRFVLEARELRGVVSNGMLASSKELAIGDDHSGILEVDVDVAPGTLFADVYELNDHIIDIENKMFTHRPDCFGILGVAREIAGIQGLQFTSPEWYRDGLGRIQAESHSLQLEVKNDIKTLVPRFVSLALSDVMVKPSPVIMQTYLSRVGIRPINNIVDVTNYVMFLTGQPLHAYDYDKLAATGVAGDTGGNVVLGARLAHEGETLRLLNGKTITLNATDVVITSNDVPVGLGGVMGGADTEVDTNTKHIVLEVANFEMYTIRRTSMRHGLFTDAVTRFNKGQSPLQNVIVMEEAVSMIESLSGAKVASDLVDDYDLPAIPSVHTSTSFINQHLGLGLNVSDMTRLLQSVECTVHEDGENLIVHPPFWRTDILIPEDVVEEIGRLHGYDNLPLDLPRRTINPARRNQMLDVKQWLRESLAKSGANEVLTYSFVHGKVFGHANQDITAAFQLANALRPDLQYYRLSVTPSILDKIHANIKAGYDEFALYELGKGHAKSLIIQGNDNEDEGLPAETDHVALVYALSDKRSTHRATAAYYQARYLLEQTVKAVGLSSYSIAQFAKLDDTRPEIAAWLAPFEPTRSAVVYVDLPGQPHALLGVIGEYRSSVQKSFKLPRYCAGFEIDTVALRAALVSQNPGATYTSLPRYPKTEQDICLKVSVDTPFGVVLDFVKQTVFEIQTGNTLPHITPVDIYQKGKHATHKNITLRLSIASYDKTLTDGEVTAMLDHVAKKAAAAIGAERQ